MQSQEFRDHLKHRPVSKTVTQDWGAPGMIPETFNGIQLDFSYQNEDDLHGSSEMVNINRIMALWLYDLTTSLQVKPQGHGYIEIETTELSIELTVELPLSFDVSKAGEFIKKFSPLWKKNVQYLGVVFKYQLNQRIKERTSYFKFLAEVKR